MCWTESMVGGTIFHRDVIQREISRALVLNLSGKTRCSGTAEEIFVLVNAFALIEGQPPMEYLLPACCTGPNGPIPFTGGIDSEFLRQFDLSASKVQKWTVFNHIYRRSVIPPHAQRPRLLIYDASSLFPHRSTRRTSTFSRFILITSLP